MALIESYQRTVYRSPSSRRVFMTAKAAARSEAAMLIKNKYPSEDAEYHEGFCTYAGFHWSSDERLIKVHGRLTRMILRNMRVAKDGK
jgi:hypothetical protein